MGPWTSGTCWALLEFAFRSFRAQPLARAYRRSQAQGSHAALLQIQSMVRHLPNRIGCRKMYTTTTATMGTPMISQAPEGTVAPKTIGMAIGFLRYLTGCTANATACHRHSRGTCWRGSRADGASYSNLGPSLAPPSYRRTHHSLYRIRRPRRRKPVFFLMSRAPYSMF